MTARSIESKKLKNFYIYVEKQIHEKIIYMNNLPYNNKDSQKESPLSFRSKCQIHTYTYTYNIP